MTTAEANDSPCSISNACVIQRQTPTILCIDDDPHALSALRRNLHKYQVEVIEAFHGMQGCWLAAMKHPDVIITDWRMPRGDGDFVVGCLKRNSQTASIPVIVLSGMLNVELARHARRLGVECCLEKPVQIDELVDALNSLTHLEEAESACARKERASAGSQFDYG